MPSVGEPRRQRRRRRVGLDVDEARRRRRADDDLAQDAAAAPTTRWVGQRVEDLVGEDDAVDRRRSPAPVAVEDVGASPAASSRAAIASSRRRLDLDRLVADRGREVRSLAPQAVEDRQRQRAGPRAVLAEDERVRATEALPGVRDGPGERRAEDRMGLGRGQEVAVAAGPRRVGRGSSRRPGRTARAP